MGIMSADDAGGWCQRLVVYWIPDTMKNMVANAPYFSIVRE